MRFLRERLHEHAQFEIQVYAIEIAKILAELYPVTMQAFKELNTEKPDETPDTTSDHVADSLRYTPEIQLDIGNKLYYLDNNGKPVEIHPDNASHFPPGDVFKS